MSKFSTVHSVMLQKKQCKSTGTKAPHTILVKLAPVRKNKFNWKCPDVKITLNGTFKVQEQTHRP